MEGGKLLKSVEDLFFFFFFHFWKRQKFVLGLPKWEFSTGKKHFMPGKKSGKMTLPLRKICLLRPGGWGTCTPPHTPYSHTHPHQHSHTKFPCWWMAVPHTIFFHDCFFQGLRWWTRRRPVILDSSHSWKQIMAQLGKKLSEDFWHRWWQSNFNHELYIKVNKA